MHKVKLKIGDIVKIKASTLHCEPVYMFYDIGAQCHKVDDLRPLTCLVERVGFEFSKRVGERAVGKYARIIGVKNFEDGVQLVAVVFWDDEECIPIIGFSSFGEEELELVRRDKGRSRVGCE